VVQRRPSVGIVPLLAAVLDQTIKKIIFLNFVAEYLFGVLANLVGTPPGSLNTPRPSMVRKIRWDWAMLMER
jgi:hypothetical protein